MFQGAGAFRSPLRLTREDCFINVLLEAAADYPSAPLRSQRARYCTYEASIDRCLWNTGGWPTFDFRGHHHNRGCPTLRDFRSVGTRDDGIGGGFPYLRIGFPGRSLRSRDGRMRPSPREQLVAKIRILTLAEGKSRAPRFYADSRRRR
jgi:hypothetical protein